MEYSANLYYSDLIAADNSIPASDQRPTIILGLWSADITRLAVQSNYYPIFKENLWYFLHERENLSFLLMERKLKFS